MKIALVHDYIKEYGGAERVLETLHEIYPDAPVFTSVYLPEFLGPHRERFNPQDKGWDIRTSFLQKVPFKEKLISPFRLISPVVFRQFDFSEFDVVIISATGAYFPNAIAGSYKRKIKSSNELKETETKFITYCHTPPRYLYGYLTARNWKNNILIRVIAETVNHFLRMLDFRYAQNVDQFIANSEEVKSRIFKFYKKDAIVIYPPVELQNKISRLKTQVKREYYLAGGRLARAKHIDLIINTFIQTGLPLKVFGKGFAGHEEELRRLAKNEGQKAKSGGNIEFLGEVSDREKYKLLTHAKAFVFASEDEDFGILPVEAMSCGTPVIAYKSGGVKETVIDGKTGLFFDKLNISSLLDAIKKFEIRQLAEKFDPENCKRQAENFSKDRFKKQITSTIDIVRFR